MSRSMVLILTALLLSVQFCGRSVSNLERRRSEFLQQQLEADKFSSEHSTLEDLKSFFIADSANFRQFVFSMLPNIVPDRLSAERSNYLQANPDLPPYIRSAVENRNFVLSMTLWEFWLSVGDTAIFNVHRSYEEGREWVWLDNSISRRQGKEIELLNGFIVTYGQR